MRTIQATKHATGTNELMVVDADEPFASALSKVFRDDGFRVHRAMDVLGMQQLLTVVRPAFAVVDPTVAGGNLSVVQKIRKSNSSARIVIVTRYASIASAVEAIKQGANDYIPKPADPFRVAAVLCGVRPESVDLPTEEAPLSVGRLEWEHIHRVLLENKGNITNAARVLGMHRRTLQRKLNKHPVTN